MDLPDITLAELGRKLDAIHSDLIRHLEDDKRLFHGSDNNPGLIVSVDRLNEQSKARLWYFRALWTAIIGLFVEHVLAHFVGWGK